MQLCITDGSKLRQKVIVMFGINSVEKLFIIIHKLLIYIKSKVRVYIEYLLYLLT